MVRKFEKGSEEKVGGHWQVLDFDCTCSLPTCKVTLIDTDLLAALTVLYQYYPGVIFTSAFRCPIHNHKVGGAEQSMHLIGKAVDVKVPGIDPHEVAETAKKIEQFRNGGIGLYRTFTHLDTRHKRARWGHI